MRKHSKNSSKKLMSGSQDSLSERQAVLFSFKEIRLKEGIASNNAYSHEIDKSSEMAVASFGDFACALKLAGLKDRRVKTSKSNKGFVGREVVDIADLGKESNSCSVTDTINGSNDFHFLNCNGRTEIGEDTGELIQLLHQMKESRNLLRQDKLLSKTIGSDRVFGSLDNIIRADRDLSASIAAVKHLCDSFRFRGSDKACRREFFEKQQHGCSEDITDGLQFGKDALKNPLDLVFCRSDMMRDSLPFSGNIPEISGVLRDGELLNGILVSEDESGNSEGVFFISLGFTQRQLGEIRDKKGIDDNSINSSVRQEREEIDMVAACGFHTCQDRGEVFAIRRNRLYQFGKTAPIHSGREGKTDITFAVNACGRERIFGNINTYKQFTHTDTSVNSLLDKAGDASQPILHDDKGSVTQSTYYGYGRQGTDSLKGSLTQVIWSSPACPTLTGKTSLHKFYNTNS